MGDDPPPLRKIQHGKGSSTARKLKRRSGDSVLTPRTFAPGDNNRRDKEKEMAASFLQFCAMCEKQIMTPCNSILYCSEACRRKDAAKPLSASNLSAVESSTTPPPSLPSSPRPTITTRVSSSGASPEYQDHKPAGIRIPFDLHDHRSDLDPTEWKPKIPHSRGASTNSEAFRYLSRFHQTHNIAYNNSNNSSSSDHSSDNHSHSHHVIKSVDHRPGPAMRHKSTLSMSTLTPSTTTPSLANSPTTTSSSFGSMYEFNLRPLAPRTNPLYSTSAGHSRSIDLVTPHIPPPVAPTVVGDNVALLAGSIPAAVESEVNDLWGRKVVKPVVPVATPKGEGLGALFGKDS
ncbi:uncharacterized protein Z520_05666 [Fonsecaea multimorphosa CBS 102226]|uniref:Uncharacterized protein n=1 Tax=Fonsecaea multimorphosa CBS 102226 TaxID=1442371 RepID=A0A0D2H924_9EURO|nr:uncharacterized protein Z520_05666 [Fonsecaea multimorphosa CBS 102226]KIX98365.1 hypothetical protein Z520_05666 [Fonsecaea multimorphosa CBS 102226]OAL24559.1 hypothetical protein AYO22_05348 [Fonsecaea multimorphosa]